MKKQALVWIIALLWSGSVLASIDQGIRLYRGKPGEQIHGLTFPLSPPDITTDVIGDNVREFAVVEGTFPKSNWSLIIGRVKVPRSRTGRFKVKTQLTSKQKNLVLAAIGPDGEVEVETIRLNYPGYFPHKKASRHNFAAGAGLTSLTYSQQASDVSDATSFSEKAITVKGSYLYRISQPNWDLGVTAFFTAFAFSPNIPNTTVRSLGLNFRFGYVLPSVKEPWRVSLMFGGYYTTMFVNPANFGFQNLSGPQLFPVVRYALKNKDTISGYVKWSPVSAGFLQLTTLSSRELAGGITYSRHIGGGHSIPISLDLSNLKSTVETPTNDGSGSTVNVPVELTTVTLGVGYTF